MIAHPGGWNDPRALNMLRMFLRRQMFCLDVRTATCESAAAERQLHRAQRGAQGSTACVGPLNFVLAKEHGAAAGVSRADGKI